jgi:hypothetical protein
MNLTIAVCATNLSTVMPGLGPGIHAFAGKLGVDDRDKPGHDEA